VHVLLRREAGMRKLSGANDAHFYQACAHLRPLTDF